MVHFSNAQDQLTPSLVVVSDLIAANTRAAIKLAGSPARLRPHAKTHKTIEIAQMLLLAGVTRHKCATIAEAEMLAMAGAPDVLVAYPLVGPNVARLATLKAKYPRTSFSSLIDHPLHIEALATVPGAEFVLDLDVGQHRTGAALERAEALYRDAVRRGLTPGGIQTYDGHNHQERRADREVAVKAWIEPVLALRARLETHTRVPRIIAGGTPTFPVLAAMDIPGLECSPGTFVLHDDGYGSKFPDIPGLQPAAVLLTRVVSRPTPTRVTLDLGTKAVASDPPLAKRLKLLDFPPYELVSHNEEHLVVDTAEADRYKPGDLVYALPGHICPSVALHKELLVAEGSVIVGSWNVIARDRKITV